MADSEPWNDHYLQGDLPWDTGQPSTELRRVVDSRGIRPCRALELGCGTGTNSVWLAQQGFDVTGIDIAPLAIAQAEARARAAGVRVRFLVGDVLSPPDLGKSFQFFFDRGCYHAVRRGNPQAYPGAVARMMAPGAMGLVLAGNAREPHQPGPPVVSEQEIRGELGSVFEILELHEFRFDTRSDVGANFLGWSCLLVKPPMSDA